MEVKYEIIYEKSVTEFDIPKLSSVWKTKIQTAIEEKLKLHPEIYGKPLRKSLKGYRKLRVGDYRVVFRIVGSKILVFGILHRSVVYTKIENRLE